MGSKFLSHELIDNHELTYLYARNYSLEERMIVISHFNKFNESGVYGMRALKAACCLIKRFYGDLIDKELLREKYQANLTMLRKGLAFMPIIAFPTLRAGAGSTRADGRYKAVSMPPNGNTCMWHAMATVFNTVACANKYTLYYLKDLYRNSAQKYKDLFVPHMYSEIEYAYMIEGRTQATLSAKHQADVSVVHVVASELGIPLCVIDDTTPQLMGYRAGSGDPNGRAIIVRHGHA